MAGVIDLDDVERVGRVDAEALALTDGEVVHAAMMADDVAGGRDELARGIGNFFALLARGRR